MCDVQVGVGSNQFVVFQTPPTVAPTYMIDELFGSDAATSTRPEKLNGAGFPGAGPIGVQWIALNVTDGDGPLSTRSTGRPTTNKMETEKTIQLLALHRYKALREYLIGIIIGVSPLFKAQVTSFGRAASSGIW